MLLGGQLATGKSSSLKRITQDHPGIVQISPDEFRPVHPKYLRS
ncbi:zeta toxin family protein [Thermobifida halotolerans]